MMIDQSTQKQRRETTTRSNEVVHMRTTRRSKTNQRRLDAWRRRLLSDYSENEVYSVTVCVWSWKHFVVM